MENVISIYKGGSGVILKNPNDEDIFCYTENREDRLYALTHNHDHTKDYHFVEKSRAKKIFFGCYAYPYMEHLEGEDLGLDKFDIHDHELEYADYLLKYINHYKDRGLTNKHWYHVYLGCCALKNKGEFTETQINKAQKIHDSGISEKDLNNIIDYLTKIVNN